MKHEIIIIGAGLAGLSAALTAAREGHNVALVSSMPSERAQSVMAEGGINAALNTKGESDSPEEHYNDTMKAGVWLADPNAVWNLVEAGPGIVRHLASLGAVFNLDDKGELDLRNFGGQKKKRTAFAMSSTGKQIMTALIQEVRKYEAAGLVIRYADHSFVDLVIDAQKSCIGCIVLENRTKKLLPLHGGGVVIAAGGMNGLFGRATGSLQNTGAVTARLFRLGVPVANTEFIQYHPTTAECSGKRLLVSEAARGEGGRLFSLQDGKPWYFMEERYPEFGNLMPRDVVSREIWSISSRTDGPLNVWLDLTHLPADVMKKKLGDLVDDCRTYLRIDPCSQPIPVSPGIHYFMGGIQVDERHRTAIPNLYAAGECCCQYHGANRLGGNSTLGAIFGGTAAAASAICQPTVNYSEGIWETYSRRALENISQEISGLQTRSRNYPLPVVMKQLHSILNDALGIGRNGEHMQAGLQALERLINDKAAVSYDSTCGLYENLMLESQCLLGKAMIMSAYNRRESRGAHYRTDYPDRNDEEYQKTTVASHINGEISIRLEQIPEGRHGF